MNFIFLVMGCERDSDYAYYSKQSRQESKDKTFLARDIFRDAKIDILFVIDNSGSMGAIQGNIITNAGVFMEKFLEKNDMKWKMGIVSTDKDERPYLGFDKNFDNDYATNHSDYLIVKEFKDSVRELGVFGDANEFVFYNVFRFMSDLSYNHFFRADAHLAIIMVTDEGEQSKGKFGPRFGPMSFINSVKALKDPGKVVRFYGAFDFGDLQFCTSGGSLYRKSPFERVISETSGLYLSACAPDFGKGLAEIGKDILSIVDSPKVLLDERPVVDSIKVYYEDRLIPPGKEEEGGYWFYSEKFSALHFYNLDFMEDRNQGTLRVTYLINDGVDRELDPRRK